MSGTCELGLRCGGRVWDLVYHENTPLFDGSWRFFGGLYEEAGK